MPDSLPAPPPPAFSQLALDVPLGARVRRAIASVPHGPAPPVGWPVVLAFHGGQTHPEFMRRFCGLDALAAAGQSIVVYPAGTGSREDILTWNGGNCCGQAMIDGADDVGFVRALLDALAARLLVDGRRIHATGMSNGAMMAYRLAAEMADRIASIAPVAGPMALAAIAPARPVPVLHFHGTLDQFTPLEGGVGRRSVTRVSHRPVVEGIFDWVHANGCRSEPRRDPIPCTDDGITVERFTWGPGRDGAEVVYYRLDGGGHTWPGRRPDSFFLGPCALSLDANRLIWEFFERHPLPAR
jgi:polyhydroxybutyrate depolymerase